MSPQVVLRGQILPFLRSSRAFFADCFDASADSSALLVGQSLCLCPANSSLFRVASAARIAFCVARKLCTYALLLSSSLSSSDCTRELA